MRNYATEYPRLFAAVCWLDRLTAPFYPGVLGLLTLAELCLCVVKYPTFTPAGRFLVPLVFPLYALAFHVCTEEDFRAKVFSYFRR